MNPKKIYPALFLMVCLLGSCMESYEDELPSLTSIIVQNPFFNKLETALIKSRLWLKLSNLNPSEENGGNYTLFGPTDEAFNAFEKISGSPLESLDSTHLRQMLSYHLAEGQINRSDFTNHLRITSDLGPEMRIIRRGSDVYVNGSKILFHDVLTKNGSFHGLDKVLWGFKQSPEMLVQLLNENRILKNHSFRIMEKVIDLSHLNPEIWENSTFLLPSDAAFKKINIDHPNDLSSWTIQELKRLLGNHILIRSEKFSSEFPFKGITQSEEEIDLLITDTGRWVITGNDKVIETRPIITDIWSNQTVIHIVDQLIFP